MQEPGSLIDGEHYPYPVSYTFGEAMLVGRLTRKGMYEFAEALEEGSNDPSVMAAYVAIAVWKKHPQWSMEDAEAFIVNLDTEKFGIVSVEDQHDDPPLSGSVEPPESTDSPAKSAA